MCDEIFELWVDYAPERPLLHCAFSMLAMQKSNVEHLFCIVSAICEQFFVLEVWMLDVSMLLKLFCVDMRLGHRRTPAVIRQINSVPKPFHASLKDFEIDALNVKLLLHFGDEIFCIAVRDGFRSTWPYVICSFA